LNSCAIIPEKYDGAICSTGFYVLTPKDINVETALVLFKSQLMQALMTRVCSGSIMAGMNTDEFANLMVPKIDPHTQHVIAKIIQDCAQKRDESIRLLELAKTAVEIAIEQGEVKAMELLTIK
jgi:restriction endonuclease S subunit